MPKSQRQFNFESALQELSTVVATLEKNDAPLDLEQSLKKFERGVALIRECQTALALAEQKIQILTNANETVPFTDFNE